MFFQLSLSSHLKSIEQTDGDKILHLIYSTSTSRAWLRLNAFLVLACLLACLLAYLLACLLACLLAPLLAPLLTCFPHPSHTLSGIIALFESFYKARIHKVHRQTDTQTQIPDSLFLGSCRSQKMSRKSNEKRNKDQRKSFNLQAFLIHLCYK